MANVPMKQDERLHKDRIQSMDHPSLIALGMTAAAAMKKTDTVVFAVDALGFVHLLPPEAVEIRTRVVVEDVDLNELSEEQSIQVMLSEGRTEEDIIAYLKRRER